MATDKDYVLSTDAQELQRLRDQHTVWVSEQYSLLQKARVGTGQRVLDIGCGPGFTSLELARTVGSTGQVIARDQSQDFVNKVNAAAQAEGLDHLQGSLGTVEELDLPENSLDAVYSRWLLCWLPDPELAVQIVARALKPGGCFVVQEYYDWAAMKLMPPSKIFDRAVDACMQSWVEAKATINIGDHLGEFCRRAGLRCEVFEPVCRFGLPGSLEWRWLDFFFSSYLARLVERGLFQQSELDEFTAEWSERSASGQTHCTTPSVANAVFRKA